MDYVAGTELGERIKPNVHNAVTSILRDVLERLLFYSSVTTLIYTVNNGSKSWHRF